MRVMELKCICRGPPAEEARTPLESEEREARSPQNFTGKQESGKGALHEVVGRSRSLGQ